METQHLRRLALERMTRDGTSKLRLAQNLEMSRESLVRVLNGRSAGTLETWERILGALNLELMVKDRITGEVLELVPEPPPQAASDSLEHRVSALLDLSPTGH